MNELNATIGHLKTKIEKLVEMHKTLKTENELHIKEINELKKQVQQSATNASDAQNKIIQETKGKIDGLVHEIDECIALLMNQ